MNLDSDEVIGCIVGAVVHLVPACDDTVKQNILSIAGVDFYTEDEHLRLVITIEAATNRDVVKLTESIQNIDGVMQVTMVYHHCEEKLNEEHERGWKWR